MNIPDPTRCAILIPTRNRPGILRDSLTRIREAGFGNLSLWIYDDVSDDPGAIARAATEAWPGAHVIHGKVHAGQAHGRNVLLQSCQCEFAIMLDDDQYFLESGRLLEHLDPARRDPACAAVSFQCRDKADGRLDVPAHITARRCASFMGGCVMFHVPSILAVGGYREFWGYGYEEPELTTRLFARGYHVWYDPSVLIEHNHIITSEARRNDVEYDFFYVRNVLLMSSMNMPLWFGLPLGLYRAIRRALAIHRNPLTKFKAILSGFYRTFRHWHERTPMSTREAVTWLRFTRDWFRFRADTGN